jgi:microcystin-dependent protein
MHAATKGYVDTVSFVPRGMINLWYGSIATIPAGWALCDGANGTPNLRDRFVVGAGSTYSVGATGGSANATLVSHTHTATVADPGHIHNLKGGFASVTDFVGGSGGDYGVGVGNDLGTGYQVVNNTTGITVTNSTEGSSSTNANLPPYYALCYIMKL